MALVVGWLNRSTERDNKKTFLSRIFLFPKIQNKSCLPRKMLRPISSEILKDFKVFCEENVFEPSDSKSYLSGFQGVSKGGTDGRQTINSEPTPGSDTT